MAEFAKKAGPNASCEPLLKEFWIDGMHFHIPLINEQKAFVAEQISRFRDLYSYPVHLSQELTELTAKTIEHMNRDENEYPGIEMPPLPTNVQQ